MTAATTAPDTLGEAWNCQWDVGGQYLDNGANSDWVDLNWTTWNHSDNGTKYFVSADGVYLNFLVGDIKWGMFVGTQDDFETQGAQGVNHEALAVAAVLKKVLPTVEFEGQHPTNITESEGS